MATIDNKRIAKNTLLLYIRMFVSMVVSLYTSRIILNALGVEDFGIYNVIAGVIGMMSFFNNSMATATQRFLNFEMGKKNYKRSIQIFSVSVIIFCLLIFVIFLLAETLGIWFIKNHLTIPASRLDATLVMYQFSILTFIFNMLSIPYQATIIAYEKMGTFAYISIFDVIGKLIIAFFIYYSPFDKLIFYSIMYSFISFSIFFFYYGYCKKKFEICKMQWKWNYDLAKQLLSFSGWMFSGTISTMLSNQGVNILINIFFGPIYNAARAVSMQVYNAVNNFVVNFMTATRPQIVKSYAEGSFHYTIQLVFTSSKFAFFLLFILSISFFFEANTILTIWLKNPPKDSDIFTQLILLDLLITAMYTPLGTLSQASGKIKKYQLSISYCFISIFLLTYLAYKLYFPAYSCFIIAIIVNLIGLHIRLNILKETVNFPYKEYAIRVFIPLISVFILSYSFNLLIKSVLSREDILYLIMRCIIYISSSLITIYFIGINKRERQYLHNFIIKIRK